MRRKVFYTVAACGLLCSSMLYLSFLNNSHQLSYATCTTQVLCGYVYIIPTHTINSYPQIQKNWISTKNKCPLSDNFKSQPRDGKRLLIYTKLRPSNKAYILVSKNKMSDNNAQELILYILHIILTFMICEMGIIKVK